MTASLENSVLVAGGGIGGLGAALALARKGQSVRVFEQAAAFSEIGAGIQMGPNCYRVLQQLGVGDQAHALAVFPDALVGMDAVTGEEIARIPVGAPFEARFGAPYALIHRADLHAILLEACRKTNLVDLRPQTRVESYTLDDSGGVQVRTTSGDHRGCALIGADGLWSKVRQQMLKDGPPRISGHIAYRAVLPTDSVPAHLRRNEMVLWAGPKCHLVQYPLRTGELYNLVAVFHSERYEEGWDTTGDPAELKTRFNHTCPEVQTLLSRIEAWRMWVLCDREPVAQWTDGAVGLIGDAAHPMLQYLAQGAGMALEDAVCMAEHLGGNDDVARGLKRYETERYLRTGRAQLTARLYGEFYHAEGVRRELRNAYLANGMGYEGLAWLYDHGMKFSPENIATA